MSHSVADTESVLPKHIAVVMDGNGRWAAQRGKPRAAGHKAGVTAVRRSVAYCLDHGIRALTIFAFSSENWRRSKLEVAGLKQLFFLSLRKEISNLHKKQVQVRFIGDLSAFGTKLQQEATKAEQLTKDNNALVFNIALNYGGQWDICQAMQHIAQQVAQQNLTTAQITPDLVTKYLATGDCPPVDLYIRTSGEQRLSNFLLWQIAYAELYFCDIFWPDFDEVAFDQAIQWFQQRDRRFGTVDTTESYQK